MFFFKNYINQLRNVSFWLFLLPTIAIVFSLIFHNLLINFKFDSTTKNYKKLIPFTIICDEKNFYCTQIEQKNTSKFENCEKFSIGHIFFIKDKVINHENYYAKFNSGSLKQLSKDSVIKKTYFNEKKINPQCIKNSKLYSLYKIFPSPFYFIEKIKNNKNFSPGTSVAVNPFIYGEVSISNIVKRFPINYLFKPLLFITSFLMIFYWVTYQKIFAHIKQSKKISNFTIFGVLSGVFLFIHFYFLGTKIDNEIFSQIRKLILLLFILFEILAQFFLTKRLYLSYDQISDFVNKKVLNMKIIFVSLIVIFSVSIIIILTFFNLDSKIDYILEWNYFLLLLVFYLLSALLWNKQKKIIL